MNWTKLVTIFNIDTGSGKIRRFGLILATIIGVLAAIYFFRTGLLSIMALGIVLIFIGASYLFLMLIKIIYYPWMVIANSLGFLIMHVLLIILFYFILTPIGLIRRIIGKDPLARESDLESYWIKKDQSNLPDLERMF